MRIRIKSFFWKLAPLSLILVMITKYILYSMGLMYTENKVEKIVSYIVYFLFFVLIIFWIFEYIKENELNKDIKRILFIFGIIFLSIGISLVRFGVNSYILKSGIENLIFCLPAFFIGEMVNIEKKEKDFLCQLEKYWIFIVLPVIGYFFMAIANINPFYGHVYLGKMNYFSVGNYLLPFFCVTFFCVCEENLEGEKNNKKFINFIRCILLTIYWLDILASGARGAVVCCLIFMLIYNLFRRVNKKKIGKTLLISASYLSIYLLMLFVYAPEGFQAVSRMNVVLEGAKEGEISSTQNKLEDTEMEQLFREEIIPSNKQDSIKQEIQKTEEKEGDQEYIEPEIKEENPKDQETTKPIINDRGQLYRLTLEEIKREPLKGMGPFGFYMKYGNYTHNIFLEILCEFGIVLGSVIILLLGISMIKLLLAYRRDYYVGLMTVFLIGLGITSLVSGTIWTNATLFFAFGYCFAYTSKTKLKLGKLEI